MSQPIKFYYDLMSQPARALYIFLKLNKIPFESCPIAIRKGEHLTESFRENINRFRKLPCIDDNGFLLAETPAILQYLIRKHSSVIPDHWYPQESKARARVDEYLSWQHMNARLHCSTFFWTKWLVPNMLGKPVNEKALSEAKQQMIVTLNIIENVWLKNQKYIAGNQISIADLLAISELEQTLLGEYNSAEGRPNVQKWMEQVRKETAPFYDEAFVVLNRVVKQLGKPKTAKL